MTKMGEALTEVLLQCKDPALAQAALNRFQSGDIVAKELMLKASQYKNILITIATNAAASLLAQWLSGYYSQEGQDQREQRTVINGNAISGNVTIEELTQIIVCPQDSNETDHKNK